MEVLPPGGAITFVLALPPPGAFAPSTGGGAVLLPSPFVVVVVCCCCLFVLLFVGAGSGSANTEDAFLFFCPSLTGVEGAC